MSFFSEFRDPSRARELAARIRRRSTKPCRFMEFCGGHTVAIFRHGIRQILPPTVEMVSGPGCPVCVTSNQDLDLAMALAMVPGVILTTFGDLFKVPGSRMSMQDAAARGADIRMVYGTLDALKLARENPHRKVVFVGIGFETTAPTIAASLLTAEKEGLENYFVLSLHKVTPPVLAAVLRAGETTLNGLVCPGHVSAVIGAQAWLPFARDFGIPCAVAGFEPVDILHSIALLVEQVEDGRAVVETSYRRGVRFEGNPHAIRMMEEVFQPGTASWRGMGELPGSGLVLRDRFRRFDAAAAFEVDPGPTLEPKGCICGTVLRGVAKPTDCALYAKVCTPDSPVGPCMVSNEGSCAAYYRFGER